MVSLEHMNTKILLYVFKIVFLYGISVLLRVPRQLQSIHKLQYCVMRTYSDWVPWSANISKDTANTDTERDIDDKTQPIVT